SSAFSNRSVSCLAVLCASAPGQYAFTIIVLMVNGGSSSRPRLRYALNPATVSKTMRNTTNGLWVSAHAEALKPTGVWRTSELPATAVIAPPPPEGAPALQVTSDAHLR